ncbi:hypothetical protein [Longimicrobium sp.]|uniref:hypothetical protein n=1 Tax=Longimicrobium sp. TaxID=2029185 RepID=UPI002C49D4B6|nr:hypothetical protein [Longimicrobium sp.]HSU16738.1 hypothetical protein [Longimicrobium sp.]
MRLQRRIAALLPAALVLAACPGTAPSPAPAGPPVNADELAVYATVIDSVLADTAQPFVIIADSTSVSHVEAEAVRNFVVELDSAFPASAIADYREKNGTGWLLPAAIPAGTTLRIFAPRTVFAPDGNLREQYAEFQRRYAPATSFHTLSRPGFDAERRHAVIVTGSHCGALCGHGQIVLLERGPAGWRIVQRRTTWVS